MYHVPNKNGEFPEVQEVGIEFGHHRFVSPSQEYLVVVNRNKEDEEREDTDLYVSFKEKNGTWTQPISFGNEVNSNSQYNYKHKIKNYGSINTKQKTSRMGKYNFE